MTDCHLACLGIEIYNKLCKKDRAIELDRKLKFFRTIPYINPWKTKEVSSLIGKFKHSKYNYGQIIVKEGT